jgi:hypothetical protein
MKYIAFDLGNVIFDFDEGPFYDEAESVGINTCNLSLYMKTIYKSEFCGVELKDLLKFRLKDYFGISGCKLGVGIVDRLLARWREGLIPNHYMVSFLKSLGSDVNVAFLSNMGWEHLRYIEAVYPEVMRLASHKHMSCEVGVAKPGILFFQSFLLQNPEYSNCIYLDDREENIISADRCGFNSIQFNLNDYKNDISKLNSKLKEIRNRLDSWYM